jgi:large subunit ribosomal protein L14
MIISGTLLRVLDNSGGRYGLCIKVLRRRKVANLGDKIVITIKSAVPGKRVKMHQIHKALVVRASTWTRRIDGSYLKWIHGACVVMNKQNLPVAKRILGPISKELRLQGHLKVISIAALAL